MKNLRKKFELFCFRNRDKGIPNLMLYIVIGTAVVYLFSQMSGNALLYSTLRFDRTSILQGQVWRLITYPLTYSAGNILLTAITLLCYYSLGRAMENVWGTLRFNLFYLTGVVMMDIYCMIFGGQASVTYLNLSLFLSYATLYPDANFLLFFIIPVKAWIFALIDLAMENSMAMITLEVRRSNTIAQNLYHACGMLDVGYRKRYYEDNKEDALIMYRDFVYPEQSETEA